MNQIKDYQNLVNKLHYRCTHRGCKETDFLIGKFGEEYLKNISGKNLLLFDSFLNEDDMMIYDWILNKITIPNQYQEIVKNIQIFHKI